MPTIKERNQSKRRALHAAREALRPPEQRIDSIDFDTTARPHVSQARLQAFEVIREWVDEFFEEVLHRSDSKNPSTPSLKDITICMARKVK